MGWISFTDPKTGVTELLGEPEFSKYPPPEELGNKILNAWKKNHPRYNLDKHEDGGE